MVTRILVAAAVGSLDMVLLSTGMGGECSYRVKYVPWYAERDECVACCAELGIVESGLTLRRLAA